MVVVVALTTNTIGKRLVKALEGPLDPLLLSLPIVVGKQKISLQLPTDFRKASQRKKGHIREKRRTHRLLLLLLVSLLMHVVLFNVQNEQVFLRRSILSR